MDNKLYTSITIKKVFSMIDIYYDLIEDEVIDLDCKIAPSTKDIYLPAEVKGNYKPIKKGDNWGGDFTYAWFKCQVLVNKALENKKLFIKCNDGAPENLIFINNEILGMFDHIYPSRFNTDRIHKYFMLTEKAKLNESFDIDIEAYSSHTFYGTQPYEKIQTYGNPFYEPIKTFKNISLVIKNEEVEEFVYKLQLAKELYEDETVSSYFKAELENAFIKIFELVSRKPLETINYQDGIKKANQVLDQVLVNKIKKDINPTVYLLGHSHMDTCWLWTEDETTKKLARTLSNAVRLLKKYKDYKFICSSTYHLKLMEMHYPKLFEDIKELVKEGRFEPNGGTYIECDCNLIGNESLIRQFIVGQTYLKEKFNYHADCFYLPDTFGYCASLPQILNKFDMPYFLTTKLSWNDSNKFPYDSFIWEGIDNSKTLVHFNSIHEFPSARAINKKANDTIYKNNTNKSLLTYGYGDGGGGPSEEMVKSAIEATNIKGIVNTKHSTVSNFMHELNKDYDKMPLYHGELFLEGHRGTLTSKSLIKQYNRILEVKLSNYEALEALSGANHNKDFDAIYEEFLINHFHDILPGTSIKEAMDNAINRFIRLDNKLDECYKALSNNQKCLYNLNKTSLNGTIIIDEDLKIGNSYIASNNKKKYIINDVSSSPLSKIILNNKESNLLKYNNLVLNTPYYKVKFNKEGEIKSLFDKKAKRELVKENTIFNRLEIYEDVPLKWDNWDIDYDLKLKKEVIKPYKFEISYNDGSTFIIKTFYNLTDKSKLTIDTIFYNNNRRIDFDCFMDFNDTHRFVKANFDTTMVTDIVRNEIQFGYINRQNYLNDTINQAKFEICQQKYSSLVEPSYCFSILNDCKYGISVRNSSIGLSLIKSGTHPDPSGDSGIRTFKYAILPTNSSFNKKDIIDEAYRFNNKPRFINEIALKPLDYKSDGVVIETIKKPFDNSNDLIIRCYEAMGSISSLKLNYNEIYETDFFENINKKLGKEIIFKPFEIKTIRIKNFNMK